MNLQFLSPNWLWALSLIAIPIIIHLFNFRRYKVVYFTNVHLLRELKKDNQSKTNLREWLILLSRILLIVFLVLAFAEPILLDSSTVKNNAQNTDLIIIIDNSFSMSAEGREGILLEQAKNKTLNIISAYPASTKVMLLTSDLSAKQLIYKTKEESVSELSQIKVSAFSIPIQNVENVMKGRVEVGNQHHLYIFSDFQKSGFEALKLDSTYSVSLIPLGANTSENMVLDTAYFYAPIHNLFEDENLIYSLTNNGTNDVVDFAVELYINDSLKAITNIDIPSGTTVQDTFIYRNISSGEVKGWLSISDFPIDYDNQIYFNYSIKESLNVGIWSGENRNPFLDAFFKNNPYYQVRYFSETNFNMDLWQSSDVIILNTNKIITPSVLSNIKQQVEQGKPLLFLINDIEKSKLLSDYLNLKNISKDSSRKKIKQINLNSSLFKNVFSKIDKTLDLPIVSNSFSINNFGEWVLKSKSGDVLLANQNRNKKHILVFGIPADESNQSFFTSPIFVPLMYNFMADFREHPIYYDVNRENTLYLRTEIKESDNIYKILSSKNSWIPEQFSTDEGIKLSLPKKLNSGYYSISYQEKEVSGFSYNYDRLESSLDFYSSEDLQKIPRVKVFEPSKIDNHSISDNLSNSRALWYYAIMLSLLFILLEILLIKLLVIKKN